MASGGLLNQLFSGGDMPGYQTTPLDANTANLIANQNNYAGQNANSIANRNLQNVPSSQNALTASMASPQNYNKSLGMDENAPQNKALGQALAQRSSRQYGETLAGLQNQYNIKAYGERNEAIQRAYGLNQRRGQIDMEQAEGMRNADYEKQMARNKTISSLLGGTLGAAGMVAGMAFGGPAGAMLGSQVGSNLGGSVAGGAALAGGGQ